jgi:hypothetical protein
MLCGFVERNLLVGGACGVDHKSLGVPDIRKVTGQLQIVDEPLTSHLKNIEHATPQRQTHLAALDSKGDHGCECTTAEVSLGKLVRLVRRVAQKRHPLNLRSLVNVSASTLSTDQVVGGEPVSQQ